MLLLNSCSAIEEPSYLTFHKRQYENVYQDYNNGYHGCAPNNGGNCSNDGAQSIEDDGKNGDGAKAILVRRAPNPAASIDNLQSRRNIHFKR